MSQITCTFVVNGANEKYVNVDLLDRIIYTLFYMNHKGTKKSTKKPLCLNVLPEIQLNGKNSLQKGRRIKSERTLHTMQLSFCLTANQCIVIFRLNDMEIAMKVFVKVMKAASDPTRIKILKMLEKRMMCVCEIQTALGVAQSTASKHLKILEDAGLVIYQKDGLWVNYLLADGSQSPYAANLLGNLRHWLNDESEIEELIQNLAQIDRFQILGKK